MVKISYIQELMNDVGNGKEEFDLDNHLQELRQENKYNPRPDLEEDSQLWEQVLKTAEKIDFKVYSILHGFRCGGAKLIIKNNQLLLNPRFGKQHEWKNPNDWKQDRQDYLILHKETIKSIFEVAMQ